MQRMGKDLRAFGRQMPRWRWRLAVLAGACAWTEVYNARRKWPA